MAVLQFQRGLLISTVKTGAPPPYLRYKTERQYLKHISSFILSHVQISWFHCNEKLVNQKIFTNSFPALF